MSHILQLYETHEFLIDKVVEFVEADKAAPTLVVVTREHARALRERLDPRRGRLLILDAHETLEQFLVDGVPDPSRFEAALAEALEDLHDPDHRTRVFGEMVAVLWDGGLHESAIRLERIWNDVMEARPLDLLCAYQLRSFADPEQTAAFLSVCGTHAETLPTEAFDGADGGQYVAELQQQAASLGAAVTRNTTLQATLNQRQRDFEDFCENAAEALHRVGPDGTILWANRAELQMLGYERDEYVGRNAAEFYVDRDVLDDVLARLLRGEEVREQPMRMRAKDGSIRHVMVYSSGMFQDGEFVSTRCSLRDVTDSVLLQEERQARLEQMAQESRRKDEFLAMLAHELRNPLTPIHHALHIADQRRDDPRAVDMALNIMERQLGHLVRLVDDLLDVTRITRGVIEIRRERVELAGLVREAVDAARLPAGDRRLMVDVPSEPVWLDGDPTRLHQVVGNLLNNACKFTGRDGSIHVLLTRDEGQAVLHVRDDGCGIPPEQSERIFEMFVQGGTRERGGLGIGLTLVRTLTELHGGSVEARSDGEGRGSEFVVRLPVLVEAAVPAPPDEEPRPEGSLRVLVVDDNEDSADSMAQLLRSMGCEVHAAYDGPEALAVAERVRPEVALLDIGLPTWSGHELARRIRMRPWGDGVLLLAWTGWGQERDREQSREAGIDRHLVKPADYPVLMELLVERVASPTRLTA